MKISNFKLTEVITTGHFTREHRATIDVSTGLFENGLFGTNFLKKKTITREIYKQSMFWFYTDTGVHTSGTIVETLVRSYEAKMGKPLDNMEPEDVV